ncbi:lytic transglycosylase domain-containing protein [Sphingomonas panacisoli]|uniref:Lytic transglycosylase domain-containing protein n=1 Tax=Sphingomonas panacisoli TaxID=1813879 RepID=A0A5B8LLM7_9SPHN|nr:lytic transglycosylase domain-containing protein [Sphingomonas panacisoli]QDZ08595.1 lytic transglycosylase domain-containing protein [Sphingomonas panacisoli]
MGVEAISGNIGNVRSAIAKASQATGIDFDYLLGQAQLESGLNPTARAGTSSATGLYQFIDQSWLGVIKQHGSEHGLDWASNAITRSGGRWVVNDPGMKSAILGLRNNPEVSATMAAEFASDNKASLEGSLGRGATGTDLYMAHFLGLGGARSFLRTMQANPNVSGAAMFPAAARANRSIFYDASGNARSLGDIYQRFAAKLDKGAAKVGAVGLASDTLDGSAGLTPAVFRKGGDFETAKANFAALAGITNLGDATVITGSGDSNDSAAAWAKAALARATGATAAGTTPPASANSVNLLRPTPDTARLAYMMLASMGANRS